MMRKVLPQRVDVNLEERDLQEPQPWEKEAKTQSLFGMISLVSFCLGAILMAMGTLHPLPFLLAMVALLMKKIQANKVLDLMEAHGMDDGKTRREQRQEQRRESKACFRTQDGALGDCCPGPDSGNRQCSCVLGHPLNDAYLEMT